MLTDEECKNISEYMDTAKMEDIYTPEPPMIEIPYWLPNDIQAFIVNYLNIISNHRYNRIRLIIDIYTLQVDYFNKVKNVFIDSRMNDLWSKLYEISPGAAVGFARELLYIENCYDGGLGLNHKHENEIKSYNKVIKLTEQLYDALEEYQCHYYGHMLQDNHDTLMDTLLKFKNDSKQSLADFEAVKNNRDPSVINHWPFTRKRRDENSLAIFFARKIFLYFKKHFGKPMHNNIAEVIEVIFNISYDENQIVKHCGLVRNLTSDNSTN